MTPDLILIPHVQISQVACHETNNTTIPVAVSPFLSSPMMTVPKLTSPVILAPLATAQDEGELRNNNERPSWFEKLPRDIVLHILSFLPSLSDVLNARLVSHSFGMLLRDRSIRSIVYPDDVLRESEV